MVNIGRNDPCPCGSGKKYKKCCLAAAEAARAGKPQPPTGNHARWRAEPMLVEDDLDALSNSVVDLINHKRIEEALTVCERLQREYPDVIDGLERFAMVHEARGSYALAADFYRRALAFTEQPAQRDGFDEQGRAYYRAKIAESEARASR